MRVAVASSARESRGERTLMGIGPEFIRRDRAAEPGSAAKPGSNDCVPTERMDRTPSSPIVVEPQVARSAAAPTVRVPISPTSRTVQLSVAPAATVQIPIEDAGVAPGRSRRLDSVISSGFFQEGERQEANGWEDSPLALEPSPEEAPPAFSSFDRIPRKRAPLVVTTFILGIALVIGFAVKGVGAGVARSWMATEAGQRVVDVLNKAKAGLTIRLTPESTVASTRAMANPATVSAPAEVPSPAPQPAPVSVATTTVPAAPLPQAVPQAPAEPKARRPLALAPRSSASRVATPPAVAAITHGDRPSGERIAPASVEKEGLAVAAPAEARATDTPERPVVEPARRGVVWSPSEQRLVPAQQAAAGAPPADGELPSAPTKPGVDINKPAGDNDKTVLPLDDEAHTTF